MDNMRDIAASMVATILLIMAILLFVRDRKRNAIIAIHFFLIGCSGIQFSVIKVDLGNSGLNFLDVKNTLCVVALVLLYYYSCLLFRSNEKVPLRTNLILAVPVLLFLIIPTIIETNLYVDGVFDSKTNDYYIISASIYFITTLFCLIMHERNYRSYLRRGEQKSYSVRFNWFIRILMLTPVLQILIFFVSPVSTYLDLAVFVLYVITPAIIPEIFFHKDFKGSTGKKYATSSLTRGRITEIFEKVELYIEQNEAYLNKNISLTSLSNDMDLNPTYISQAINEERQISFTDFINQYRIAKAIELINSEAIDSYKIEAISEFAGFSSKATFYRAFKKKMGMTPSQMIKDK